MVYLLLINGPRTIPSIRDGIVCSVLFLGGFRKEALSEHHARRASYQQQAMNCGSQHCFRGHGHMASRLK